jgi:hypothetical protein
MQTFKVAHINQQGVDLIIIPLDPSYALKTLQEQHAIRHNLQIRANAARLRGTVVPVWDAGFNRMGYLAPQNWHPFFDSIDLFWVFANVNRQLRVP